MFEGLPKPIIKHIHEKTNQEVQYEPNVIRCTELLYCLRKPFFRRKYKDKIKLSENQRWWIYRGNIFDEIWTSLFEKNQVKVEYQVNDELKIIGHADFIYENCVYDLKTISSVKWLKEPKEQHVKQVKFYAYCLGLEKAKLIYVSFDGFKVFDLDCSDADEVVKELVELALKLHGCLKEDKPPEKNCQDWECRYCEVREYCGGGSDG